MRLEKITSVETGFRRRYEDACGAAHALDLVGDRWALLVMRELMLGPKRFSDLRADLPGISANVLTQRLEELERVGVLVRRKLPPPAAVQVYELTPWGYESEPIFLALCRWAVRSPLHDPRLPISPTAFMLSLRTMFDPARAQGFEARIGFRFDQGTFLARLEGGALHVARSELDDVQVVISGPVSMMLPAFYGKQPLPELMAAGALAVHGDMTVAERFIALFHLPPKVDAPEQASAD